MAAYCLVGIKKLHHFQPECEVTLGCIETGQRETEVNNTDAHVELDCLH